MVIACRACGLSQVLAETGTFEVWTCSRCHSPLAQRAPRSIDAALACALATLLLLLPAMTLPFLTTSLLGTTRTSFLRSSVEVLWTEGWPLLALLVCLCLLILPLLRFAALTAVLGALRLGSKPPWMRPLFDLANALETWAMLDVFLLGFAIAYARLNATILVDVDSGARCFIAAAVLSLFTRAALDKDRVRRMIASHGAHGIPHDVACGAEVPAKRSDAPCVAAAPAPRPDAARAASVPAQRRNLAAPLALLSAAAILYVPANGYAIATIPIGLTATSYTVLGGIKDLLESHFMGLAVLVFCASLAVPLLKMVGILWCLLSVMTGSREHLVTKTRVYRWLAEIGRWSMVDPFTIACFVPVLNFNNTIYARAEPAAVPFAAVVILTTLAAKSFDPRRLWDGASPTTVEARS